MANSHNSQKRLIEVLWQKINTAILDSPEVRAAMRNLSNAGQLDSVKEFNLMLDVEKLIEETLHHSSKATSDLADEALGELLALEKSTLKKLDQLIDGKSLTAGELGFQEYLIKQFDEDLWMKQAGIYFQEDV